MSEQYVAEITIIGEITEETDSHLTVRDERTGQRWRVRKKSAEIFSRGQGHACAIFSRRANDRLSTLAEEHEWVQKLTSHDG